MINRSVAFMFASSVGSNAVSLLTISFYLHALGTGRFGVIAFVWLIVGYFGLFILGLDKAIITLLSKHRHDPVSARSLFHTAAALNLLTGCVGGLVLYLCGYYFISRTLVSDSQLSGEVLQAMPWIAASVPLATITSLLIGTLEAYQRFSALAVTQLIGTILFQVVPLLVASYVGPELTWVIPAAIVSRTAATLGMLAVIWPVLQLGSRVSLERRWIWPLISFGGWVSLSGIISPVLVSLDRVVIGAILGSEAIAYYIVPSNFISAIQLFPNSLLRVLFPELSNHTASAAKSMSIEAVRSLAVAVTPIVTVGILGADFFIKWWLGQSFGSHAAGIAEILLFGAWANCLAWVPSSLLTAQGRPGQVARLHVLELPFFVLIVAAGVWLGGVPGAAIACSARMWADALLLFKVSGLFRPITRIAIGPMAIIVAALMARFLLPAGSGLQFAVAALVIILSAAWSLANLMTYWRNRSRATVA